MPPGEGARGSLDWRRSDDTCPRAPTGGAASRLTKRPPTRLAGASVGRRRALTAGTSFFKRNCHSSCKHAHGQALNRHTHERAKYKRATAVRANRSPWVPPATFGKRSGRAGRPHRAGRAPLPAASDGLDLAVWPLVLGYLLLAGRCPRQLAPRGRRRRLGTPLELCSRRSFSARRHSPTDSLSTSSRLFLPPHVCRVRTPRVTRSASADSQRRCGASTPWPARQPRTSALPAREGGRSRSLFYFHKMHIPEVRGETRVSPLTQNAVRRPKEEGVDIRPSNHAEESSKEEESKNLGGGPDEKAVLCVFRQMLVLVIPV